MLNAFDTFTRESTNALRQFQQFQQHWLQQATPEQPEHLPAALPLSCARHALQVQGSLRDHALHQLHHWQHALPHLFSALQAPTTWSNLMAFQLALLERLAGQQQDWLQGLQGVAREAAESRRVNTLSKLLEQEYNIAAQFTGLLAAQASAFTELLENAQVDLGYLLSQHNPEAV